MTSISVCLCLSSSPPACHCFSALPSLHSSCNHRLLCFFICFPLNIVFDSSLPSFPISSLLTFLCLHSSLFLFYPLCNFTLLFLSSICRSQQTWDIDVQTVTRGRRPRLPWLLPLLLWPWRQSKIHLTSSLRFISLSLAYLLMPSCPLASLISEGNTWSVFSQMHHCQVSMEMHLNTWKMLSLFKWVNPSNICEETYRASEEETLLQDLRPHRSASCF